VDGFGIPVASPIANVPAGAAALRELATPQARTATVGGESLPVLIVSQGTRRTAFYDLTIPPPVLRTVDSPTVKIAEGSAWRHAAVIGGYSEAELESILTFLRAIEPK
jgi:hypothetical protein